MYQQITPDLSATFASRRTTFSPAQEDAYYAAHDIDWRLPPWLVALGARFQAWRQHGSGPRTHAAQPV